MVLGNARSIFLIFLSIFLTACTTLPEKQPDLPPLNSEIEGKVIDEVLLPELPDVTLTGDILYRFLEAEMAFQRRHLDIASSQYLSLAIETKDPRLAARAARVANFARDKKRTLRAATLWVETDPHSIEARQGITAAYIRNEMPEKAIEHLDFILANAKGDPDKVFMMIASLLSRENDVLLAFHLMKEFIKDKSDNATALYALSHLAIRAGALAEAQQAILAALRIKPDWVSGIVMRGKILQLQLKKQQAEDYMREASLRFPQDLGLKLTYARILVDNKQFEKAIAEFERAVVLSPNNSEVLFTLGLLSLQIEQLDNAEKYFKRAKKSGVRLSDINFYQGQLEETRKNYHIAQQYYQAVVQGANRFQAKIRLAIISARLGDIKSARQQLLDLRAKASNHHERLYLVEGDILRDAGKFKEAFDLYSEGLEKSPGHNGLLYARSHMAEKLDKIDVAEADLKAIIKADPNNADALNALGYTLAVRTKRYDEAFKYIKKALDLRPNDNAILDSMGWVLYRLGKFVEAEKYLRQSFAIEADPEVAAHLGEVLWVMGNQEQAALVWNQAILSAPDDQGLIDVMKRFGLK